MEENEDFLDALCAVQDGDLESVHDLIGGRIVPVNSLDESGCSLLHWAAINNRMAIAKYLVDNGLSQCAAGGILNETPLQWAVRKQYYTMMDFLYQHTQCDLASKSVQGNDALMLACKLGDVYATFLLLHWGASPDTIDVNGDTPLLWLVKNKTAVAGSKTQEIIKLLISFGANVCLPNANDGNTPLHALALAKKKVDLKTTHLIYAASGSNGRNQINKEGLTPYHLAVSVDYRIFATFLYDSMMFDSFPYHTPTIASGILFVALFCSLYWFGAIYGAIYWGLLHVFSSWAVLQWQVVEHRGRCVMGTFAGFILCQVVTFRGYISSYVSTRIRIFYFICLVSWCLVTYRFMTRKPLTADEVSGKIEGSAAARSLYGIKVNHRLDGTKVKITGSSRSSSEQRAGIVEAIVQSAPCEGTEEEYQLWRESIEGEGDYSASNNSLATMTPIKQSKASGVRFEKDAFTGKLRRVEVQGTPNVVPGGSQRRYSSPGTGGRSENGGDSSDSLPQYKGRTMGPKICGCCLVDRRGCAQSILRNKSTALPENNSIVSMFLPNKPKKNAANATASGEPSTPSSSSSTNESSSGLSEDDVITVATHCGYCGKCFVDQDHHSLVLGNCVGKGNRRLYWLWLFLSIFVNALYFFCSKHVHQNFSCPHHVSSDYSWFVFSMLAKEWCALRAHTAFYLLSCSALAIALWYVGALQLQVACVARETTYQNLAKRRYELRPPPRRRMIRNVLTFMYSGYYNVTYPYKRDARGATITPGSGERTGRDRSDSLSSITSTGTFSNGQSHNGGIGASGIVSNSSSKHVSIGGLSAEESQKQYASAVRLLQSIDQRIAGTGGTGSLASFALPASGASSGHESKRRLSNASTPGRGTTANYVAPNELDDEILYGIIPATDKTSAAALPVSAAGRLEEGRANNGVASPPPHDHIHDHHEHGPNCNHGKDVEYYSDYDDEFVNSVQNKYQTYYFVDSDDEKDGELAPFLQQNQRNLIKQSVGNSSSAPSTTQESSSVTSNTNRGYGNFIDVDER